MVKVAQLTSCIFRRIRGVWGKRCPSSPSIFVDLLVNVKSIPKPKLMDLR